MAVGWFFLGRRKKRTADVALSELTNDGRPEMTAQDVAERSGKERFEIQDKDPPIEVEGDLYRAELPTMTEREDTR